MRMSRWLKRTIVALLGSLIILALVVAVPTRVQAARMAGGITFPVLLDSDFSTNAPAGFPLGRSASYDESIGGGRYTLSVADGQAHIETPVGAPAVADGYLRAVVRLVGRGQVGVSARMNSLTMTGYNFWIDRQGRCGGARQADGGVTTLFGFYSPAIVPTGDNALSLEIVHGRLTFAINGQTVYDVVDPQPLPSGTWGLYVHSNPGDGGTAGQYVRATLYGDAAIALRSTLPTGPFRVALDYDFSLGDNDNWYVGRFAHSSVSFDGGRLNMATTDGYSLYRNSAESPVTADGQVDAVVRLRGAGRIGVTGRAIINLDSHYSLYACWFDSVGDVGLTREVDGQPVTQVMVDGNGVHPYQDNSIALRVQSGKISCYANGARVLTYVDVHPLAPGRFGLYVSDFPGGRYTEGQFARILFVD